MPIRPRTVIRVARCRTRSLAVMGIQVRGCGRNHVNIKRRGRGCTVRRPVRTVVKPRRRKYKKAAGRAQEISTAEAAHHLPGPGASKYGTAPRKQTRTSSPKNDPTPQATEKPSSISKQFAFSRTTTKTRTDTESPLNVRRARREYMEDAPAEPFSRSIWKTPCGML